MPALTVSNFNGAPGVEEAVAKIEKDGGAVSQIVTVGDQYVILYTVKKPVGRPPKETRA